MRAAQEVIRWRKARSRGDTGSLGHVGSAGRGQRPGCHAGLSGRPEPSPLNSFRRQGLGSIGPVWFWLCFVKQLSNRNGAFRRNAPRDVGPAQAKGRLLRCERTRARRAREQNTDGVPRQSGQLSTVIGAAGYRVVKSQRINSKLTLVFVEKARCKRGRRSSEADSGLVPAHRTVCPEMTGTL